MKFSDIRGIGLQNRNLRANFDHFWHRKVFFVCFLSVLDVGRAFRAHLVLILMHFGAQNNLKHVSKFSKFRNWKPMIRGAGFIRFSDGLDIPLVHPLVCHRILCFQVFANLQLVTFRFRNVNAARRGSIDDLRC